MRLHRLEVEGFGPFRTRQVVDFDAFTDDGIFLIAGRTGAGKTSILDAVCFGLYGGVPRYETGDKRLRSDHCEPDDVSEVVVEFSTTAGRFRVTRSPEYLRPAKRGGGMTKQTQTVSLDEWTDAGWVGRAARAVDVGIELDAILQLSREQFLQVILLAQNRFSEFLLANSKDRQALLRRLFGTERFEDVQARFDERRRRSEQALGSRLASVIARIEEGERLVTNEDLWGVADTDDPSAGRLEQPNPAGRGPGERIDQLRRALARAEYRAERRAAERDDAERGLTETDAALTDAREQRAAQTERDRARAALELLDAQEATIDDTRRVLARARAAEGMRSFIVAFERAVAAVEKAEREKQRALADWRLTAIDLADESADALQAWAAERTRESGAWQLAADLERTAATRESQLLAARDAVAQATRVTDEIDREREALPGQIAELTRSRDDARRRADRSDELTRRRDEAMARRDAASDVERLTTALAAAERELAADSAALATAQTQLAGLRQRRLDGFAGELASALTDGAPCPVCGAMEHPSPAEHADPVSADDVDEAEAARDLAADSERGAAERVSALRADVAAASARAGESSVAQAESELQAATAALAASLAEAQRLNELGATLDHLMRRTEELEQERAAAARALADARETLAVREQAAADADALIAEARGDSASVAARLEAARAQIEAATALATALLEHSRQAGAAENAAAELDAALRESLFDDVAAVTEALRPAAEIATMEERITAHVVQREKEKAVLLPLEMRALPEEPLDIAPVEQAATAARTAWKDAVESAGRAATAVERLQDLVTSAAAEHARTAEQAAEHDVLQNLADTIAGRGANTRKMTLETFVLAAELEEIVSAANRRLSDMSTGRYQLRHSDALAARGAASGLGIVVFDAFTGQTRPAQSLSGGETFLGSLALALGLAEVVTARAGGIRLDTLFIDEGFGSLDGDTLDTAMRTLDELRQGGRTVGVISHVEAMQEQIPAQLLVRATPSGPSIIEMR
ncbi:SMC family ATPase [Microbacterium sp.]|uniref:SMC family ATPase n=1 Tax=Microbacterium sp. TaxID=51671 RepID=UPI0028116E37|nr:SMC family ATPase [Microbacterium sp.]